MNAATPLNTAHPMSRLTFTAWWQLDEGARAQPETLRASTLHEIQHQIAHAGNFGKTVFVLEHDAVTGAQTLHAYRIRRGKWDGGYDRANHSKTYRHSADKLFALPVDAFEPTHAWRVTRSGDVVGIDRGLIEGQAVRS